MEQRKTAPTFSAWSCSQTGAKDSPHTLDEGRWRWCGFAQPFNVQDEPHDECHEVRPYIEYLGVPEARARKCEESAIDGSR